MSAQKESFAAERAGRIADRIGIPNKAAGLGSVTSRFVYFQDDTRLLLVVGAQEAGYVQQALPIGLALAHQSGRRLVLALPASRQAPTMYRLPWLRDDARPKVWVHDGRGQVIQAQGVTRREAIESLCLKAAKGDLTEEFLRASTALHFGDKSGAVLELADWATRDPRLDPAHRQSERAWHFRGQRVLSIRRSKGGLVVRGGIHYGDEDESPEPIAVTAASPLTPRQAAAVRDAVEKGIAVRLGEGRTKIGHADEHWLQSSIRRDPATVGIEQPALREFPAWRPSDTGKGFGRGYIDLLGLDGQGNIRIAEAKLAGNDDPMFVLQGLDYYIWAQAYRQPLGSRLGASGKAATEIHYLTFRTSAG